jgi:adhesin transport system membrane fusion protein
MSSPSATMSDRRIQFASDRPPQAWIVVIASICAFLLMGGVWASWAEVDEISRADGRVIPSGKTQIIQSAEAGVITEILVRPGEQVTKGQQLIRLDDTGTSSSAGEVEARVNALRAQVARLKIEYENTGELVYVCPDEIRASAPSICENEANLLDVRGRALAQGKDVLLQRVEQRRRELSEVESNSKRLEQALKLANENLDLLKPLADKGLVAQTDFIAAQRDVNDLTGQIEAGKESTARLTAALSEAELQVQQADLQFRQDALSEMTLRLAELASSEEQLRGAADRQSRTEIRSPVDGIINNLEVNTIGAVVAAGARLLDIVPVSETLVVEAHLKPSDVAFVLPGQQARIKLTAYDFSIFGGLMGEVENVSADSIVDPQSKETYYIVRVKADSPVLKYRDKELPILPGMVTNVEILTGEKTILQYLLKPINKARDEAFGER